MLNKNNSSEKNLDKYNKKKKKYWPIFKLFYTISQNFSFIFNSHLILKVNLNYMPLYYYQKLYFLNLIFLKFDRVYHTLKDYAALSIS